MNKHTKKVLAGFTLSVGLLCTSATALLMHHSNQQAQFQMLGEICTEFVRQNPQAETALLSALKEYTASGSVRFSRRDTQYGDGRKNLLQAYGYRKEDFSVSSPGSGLFPVLICFLFGVSLFLFTLLCFNRRQKARIAELTDYLEQVNHAKGGLLPSAWEDAYSGLQDEIYKTVTSLFQAREAALKARRNFADNLSNIAHQLKTPLTSISLSAQMMTDNPSPKYSAQIKKQLARLTHLEESLLLLSRIDAGALPLKPEETDVFTLLTLASDHLQTISSRAEVTVEIPELGETVILADPEWTMEAVMNLMKNCIEHTPAGGRVCCDWEQNPLYTRIRIWDTGPGFANEDLPHLFERFYRGKNETSSGIGIGLFLSRAIVERQNGTLSARNLPGGGACFEIHFYCH